jgi:hypothetical protein
VILCDIIVALTRLFEIYYVICDIIVALTGLLLFSGLFDLYLKIICLALNIIVTVDD